MLIFTELQRYDRLEAGGQILHNVFFNPARVRLTVPLHGRFQVLFVDALANGWVGGMDVIISWTWMQRPKNGLVA